MTEAEKSPEQSTTSKAEAMALLEEAEAEAAEAEALAAAARARARAARLRREALAEAATESDEATEPTEPDKADEPDEPDVARETQPADAGEDVGEMEDLEGEPPEETIEETTDDTTEDATEDTTEAAEPEAGPGRRRRWLPSLSTTLKAAAIVLICAFIGTTGYLVWQDREATEREQRAASFIAGAKQGIVNMTSLDYNRAKEDVQRVLDSSTGQFRDDFQRRAKDFTTVVEQSKVVTQGTVTAAGIESMDEHSASVLVSATSRISNSAGAKDEPRMWRLRVTVTEEGGQYKMSKVDFIT
jgi:Mce-associated membrane protein